MVEGLRHPAATSNRLRVTTVLNAVGKRGPFLGNTLAVLCTFLFSACVRYMFQTGTETDKCAARTHARTGRDGGRQRHRQTRAGACNS